jgi:hypothetical protein
MNAAQYFTIAQDLYLGSIDTWLALQHDTDSSSAARREAWVLVDILRDAVDRAGERWTGESTS